MTLDNLELENNICSSFRREYFANSIRNAVAVLLWLQLCSFTYTVNQLS